MIMWSNLSSRANRLRTASAASRQSQFIYQSRAFSSDQDRGKKPDPMLELLEHFKESSKKPNITSTRAPSRPMNPAPPSSPSATKPTNGAQSSAAGVARKSGIFNWKDLASPSNVPLSDIKAPATDKGVNAASRFATAGVKSNTDPVSRGAAAPRASNGPSSAGQGVTASPTTETQPAQRPTSSMKSSLMGTLLTAAKSGPIPSRPPVQNKFNTSSKLNVDELNSTQNNTAGNTSYDSDALRKRVMGAFEYGQQTAGVKRFGAVGPAPSQRLGDLGGRSEGTSGTATAGLVETTENERAHDRKQLNLKFKREAFNSSREAGPPKESWGKSDTPEGSVGSRGSGSSSASPIVLDIAAMKQLYAGRVKNAAVRQQNDQLNDLRFKLFNVFPGAKKNKDSGEPKKVAQKTVVNEVTIPDSGLTVRELSQRLSMKVETVRLELQKMGEDINDPEFRQTGGVRKRKRIKKIAAAEGTGDDTLIDADVAELLVLELGLGVKREKAVREFLGQKGAYSTLVTEGSVPSYPARNPIVCVMGHVDHGKTTLMDRLRAAQVAAGEAGGITQKLSAFSINIGNDGRKAVFIDTPGHAAFAAMRSSGTAATDIAILVVAMDDGVRPQTAEVIKLARSAKCTLIVALNKVDKIPESERPAAKQRVLSQLMELDVAVEEFGGDVFCVAISGKTGDGVDALLEGLLLQTDLMELSAPTEGLAEATVLDSCYAKGKGVVVDCLVRWGKLEIGDHVVVGTSFGTVKSLTDDTGRSITEAGPSMPVQIIGLKSIPTAGQEMISVDSEEEAKRIVERRIKVAELKKQQVAEKMKKASTMSDVGVQVQGVIPAGKGESGKVVTITAVDTVGATGRLSAREVAAKLITDQGGVVDDAALAAAETLKNATLNVILKADGNGALEALNQIVDGLNARTNDARIRVISSGVGAVVKSDIELLSTAQNGLICGFNVGFGDSNVKNLAKRSKIDVMKESVIYRLEDEMVARLEKLMPKERKLISQGVGKVLKLFPLNNKQGTVVAGLNVTSGCFYSGNEYVYAVKRNNTKVLEESVPGDSTLRRFKDVVPQVASGLECGLSLGGYNDFLEGDEIECFKVDVATKVLKLQDDSNTEYKGGFDDFKKYQNA